MSVTRTHWIRDEPPLFSSITGQRTTVADSTRTDRLPRTKEFVEVVAIYVALALLGQFTAIAPGNVTPIYPAAGFAMACVLMRGPRVWPAIWLGQLLGNMWAFVDFSHTGAALTTSGAGAVTASGAALQALVGAYLIKTVCGAGSPFNQLWSLFAFVCIIVVACSISAGTSVTGMSMCGIISWDDYGPTLLTWYLGDLVGAVLFLPLIITWPLLLRSFSDGRRALETGVVLSLVLALGAGVFYECVPLQLVGNSLFFLTLSLTLWAALRLAQPGVALFVNIAGALAALLTTRGSGPFTTNDTNVALELLQLFLMVTMIAGLSLAIAIDQLKRTESSFRLLWVAIEQAGDAIFLVHPDASLAYANTQATKLLGYSSEELMSMAVHDIDPNFPASMWPDFWRDKIRQEVLHFESIVHRKDGTNVPIEVSVSHLAVDGKELACAIVKDISARKRAEETRSVFEQILNSTSAVIYQKDLQGRYEFVNERWRYLFDIDPAAARGKTDYELFPSRLAAAFRHNDDQVIENRQSIKLEEVAPHADGPHTYISVKFPVWDGSGKLRGIAGISTDITEQLAAKEELKNSERLATIGKMITGLAHECRNALQRSQACLSLLLREVRTNPKATDYANRVQQAQDHLQHVFEELRSYASPLHIEKTRANLRSLIEETWEQITSVANPPDICLRIIASQLDLTCDVDAFRIQQVFRNIFENAISAAPTGSTITVTWSKAQLADRPALRTTIRDQGPGFTAAQRARAFKPFYTTKVTGTGLGLTITRRIVECHEGQIDIEGDSNSGGIVVVTLPQKEGEQDGVVTEDWSCRG